MSLLCYHVGVCHLRVRTGVDSAKLVVRDFMEPIGETDPEDYFGHVHQTQEHPEFTVRNINQLINHERPIPHNLYGIIRARDIFDRVDSYKTFLEDVRS